MNKFLEKIAGRKKGSKNKKGSKVNYNLPLAGAGGLAAAFATPLATNATASYSLKGITDQSTNKEISNSVLRRILKNNKDMNVTFSPHKFMGTKAPSDGIDRAGKNAYNFSSEAAQLRDLGRSTGPIYLDKDIMRKASRGKINASRSYINRGQGSLRGNRYSVIHELGHAKDHATNKYARSLLLRAVEKTGVGAGTLIGAGMLGHEKTRDHAWIAPVVGAAPQLFSEGKANYYGQKLLREAGAKTQANKFLRTMALKNMINYGSIPAAAAGALAGVNYLHKKKSIKNDK